MGTSPASRDRNLKTHHVARADGRQAVYRVWPVFSRIGIIESTGIYDYTEHTHSNYEVIIVERGTYRATLNGNEFMLSRGEGLVVKPGDLHADFCRPPLVYMAVGFVLASDGLGSSEPPGLFASGVPPTMQLFRPDREVIHPIFSSIQREAEHADELSAHVQDALLLQLFWHLVRALPREAVSATFLDLTHAQAFPAQLMRVFKAHIDRPLSLARMSELMGISESSLSHKCKKLLGTSPARAFLGVRMERAMQLLTHTSMLIKEIAASLGFDDQYAFSRAFTRHFGSPPSAYRST